MPNRKGKRALDQLFPLDKENVIAPSHEDADSPELTEEFFQNARPAAEVLPGLVDREAADRLLKRRGRPAGSGKKEQLTVRFDSDVIEAFKSEGEGWQTRMNDALRQWLAEHKASGHCK